jgi:putative flippase GtrA
MPRQLVDWLRFNAVGIIGVGVQLTTLALLRSGLEWSVAWSTAVAVECAVIHNFIWHERWTWAYRKLHLRGMPGRLLRFNLSNGLISIVGNLVLMQLLAVRLHLNYMVANLAAILVCSLVNFLVSDKLVFKRTSA